MDVEHPRLGVGCCLNGTAPTLELAATIAVVTGEIPSASSSLHLKSRWHRSQNNPSLKALILMAHIALPEGLPAIRGAMAFRPETATPLNDLVEVLPRGPSSLTPGELELIATYVSSETDC